ncbi:MAG: hypothetical protein U1E60_31590 [Reyranellaceae bacterium]
MEAGSNGTACGAAALYERHEWGETIKGTKTQLQAFGLGVGMSFPGEPNGPKRSMRVIDARGLACTISPDRSAACYTARIPYPWVPEPPSGSVRNLPHGVRLLRRPWTDTYEGTAEALVALGVVQADHLPGAPGMHKACVRLFADGSVANAAAPTPSPSRNQPVTSWVTKDSANRFSVHVDVDNEEETRWRRAALAVEVLKWSERARARQPAPLLPVPPERLHEFTRASACAAADAEFQIFLARLQRTNHDD